MGALPIKSQCEPYVWAQWGLSLSESLCDPPCSYPWRLSRSDCSVSPPIRTSGLEVRGSSVPRVQRALTSLRLPNPRFRSTVTLRLSVLRRLPLSVGGGGSLWTSAARLPSGPRAPCPIRDIWGPLLFELNNKVQMCGGVFSSPALKPPVLRYSRRSSFQQWREAP